jgi:hypothetical protein
MIYGCARVNGPACLCIACERGSPGRQGLPPPFTLFKADDPGVWPHGSFDGCAERRPHGVGVHTPDNPTLNVQNDNPAQAGCRAAWLPNSSEIRSGDPAVLETRPKCEQGCFCVMPRPSDLGPDFPGDNVYSLPTHGVSIPKRECGRPRSASGLGATARGDRPPYR